MMRERRLLRYTLEERIVHWMAALTYIYLLLTGLAFYTPHLYWIASFLGGGPTVRAMHPWFGLLFLATVIWMYRQWSGDMVLTTADRAWTKSIGRYVRNEDEHLPPIGRFNAGQKQFFWIMFWAGLALLISGLVLWRTDLVPWNMRWGRYLAVLTHVIAFLATVAGFIVHVYMGTAVVRGGFTSILRGEVTEGWAKAHHRLWFEQQAGK